MIEIFYDGFLDACRFWSSCSCRNGTAKKEFCGRGQAHVETKIEKIKDAVDVLRFERLDAKIEVYSPSAMDYMSES